MGPDGLASIAKLAEADPDKFGLTPETEDLPEWRRQLSERLQRIKQERESGVTLAWGEQSTEGPSAGGTTPPTQTISALEVDPVAVEKPKPVRRPKAAPKTSDSSAPTAVPEPEHASPTVSTVNEPASRGSNVDAVRSATTSPVKAPPDPMSATGTNPIPPPPSDGEGRKAPTEARPRDVAVSGPRPSRIRMPRDYVPQAPGAQTAASDPPNHQSDETKQAEPVPLFQGTKNEMNERESVAPGRSVEFENLIDRFVQHQNRKEGETVNMEEEDPPPTESAPLLSDRLILLSRTLSGLVDLIIVIVCGCAFILLADMTSGIRVFDGLSLIHYGMLSLGIFFVYSLFFLGTSNQTIGMMITELRVIGEDRSRPHMTQLISRSVLYLVSLLGLGLGLLLGVFSSESACLHDRLSRTRVVRLSN